MVLVTDCGQLCVYRVKGNGGNGQLMIINIIIDIQNRIFVLFDHLLSALSN